MLRLQNGITVINAAATIPYFVYRKPAQSLVDPI
jgi:hypothetical protein